MAWRDYADKHNLIHNQLNPNEFTTTNSPLYSGLYLLLGSLVDGRIAQEYAPHFILGVKKLFIDGEWYSSPNSPDPDFSHDNWCGLIAGLIICEKLGFKAEVDNIKKNIPVFHWQNKHPKDLVLIGYFKYPKVFFLLLWIPMIAMIWSAFTTFKIRNDIKIPKTESKFMALMWCYSYNMKLTHIAVHHISMDLPRPKPLPRNAMLFVYKIKHHAWTWHKWENILYDYFNDWHYPSVKLAGLYDKELRKSEDQT